MENKQISYLTRNFAEYNEELLKFSNAYYPEMQEQFNDASVGKWFIDLVSAVGDDLSYHIDRAYQEANINTCQSKSSVFNAARMNGLKVPGAKASLVQVEFSCKMPLNTIGISQPDWKYAPFIKRDTTIACGDYKFELAEDVNFAEEFNYDGFSNRKFVPSRDNNGAITAYTVTKVALARGIQRKVYKKVISPNELEPFMTITLPDLNIGSVESIIFKETTDYNATPDISEYFYDEEEYQLKDEVVNTYRYFETDSLVEQWRFGTETSRNDEAKGYYKIVDEYIDYTESGEPFCRIYKGKWKPLTQKFVTEYTDNGYLNVIFGSGVRYEMIPEEANLSSKFSMAKLVNNDMLGVLPKEGWTMFILYNVVYGTSTNFAKNSINSISYLDASFQGTAVDQVKRNLVTSTLSVTNTSNAVAGKDFPSVDEVRWLIKYNTSSQNRCVTVKDYKKKVVDMPPRYGCPFRCGAWEENNKIMLALLGMNSKGKLDSVLPQTLANNIIEYLSHYKQINDYIEIRSGKIYNLHFELELFVDKDYTVTEVLKSVIEVITDYMDVRKRDMGDDIYIGDLEKEITSVDGVTSIVRFEIYNLWGGGYYSNDKCPLPERGIAATSACNPSIRTPQVDFGNARSFMIDLAAVDGVLYGDVDAMYELKDPNVNIAIKVKQI